MSLVTSSMSTLHMSPSNISSRGSILIKGIMINDTSITAPNFTILSVKCQLHAQDIIPLNAWLFDVANGRSGATI